jgi:hypothetical protein
MPPPPPNWPTSPDPSALPCDGPTTRYPSRARFQTLARKLESFKEGWFRQAPDLNNLRKTEAASKEHRVGSGTTQQFGKTQSLTKRQKWIGPGCTGNDPWGWVEVSHPPKSTFSAPVPSFSASCQTVSGKLDSFAAPKLPLRHASTARGKLAGLAGLQPL